MTTAENSKERMDNAAMTGRLPRKSIQNVQLATKRTTRRNDVGKALEPTSSPKPDTTADDTSTSKDDAKNTQPTSILKNPKN